MKDYTQKLVSKIKNHLALVVFLLIASGHALANFIWIFLNQAPPPTDAALHSVLSFRFLNYCVNQWQSFNPITFLQISNYYPPLTHLLGMLFGFFSYWQYQAVQLTGTVFLLITLVYLYLYSQIKFKNKWLGVLATLFFGFYLYIFKESRDHMTDLPLTAFFMGGLYYLEKANHFLIRKYSLWFAIFAAFAMMSKWTAPIFFLIPFVLKPAKNWQNFWLAALVFLLIAAPWYLVNGNNILALLPTYGAAAIDNPQNIWGLKNFLFYPKLIIMFQLNFIGSLFFILSLILIAVNKQLKTWRGILLIIVFNYLFFTLFIGDKNVRILFPIMPLIALLMGQGAWLILQKNKSTILTAGLFITCLYYLFAYLVLSFGFPIFPQYKHAFNLPMLSWTDTIYLHTYPVSALYNQEYWPNKEVAQQLLQLKQQPQKQNLYLILTEKPYLNAATVHLALYEAYQGIPNHLQEADTNFFRFLNNKARFASELDLKKYLLNINLVVVPEQSVGPENSLRDYAARTQIQNYFLENKAIEFEVIKKITLPDKDTIRIYYKNRKNL